MAPAQATTTTRDERKRLDAEAKKAARAEEAKRARVDGLEVKIAAIEQEIRELEGAMTAPGFYDDRAVSGPVVSRHQALMWEVGELMHLWEALAADAGGHKPAAGQSSVAGQPSVAGRQSSPIGPVSE